MQLNTLEWATGLRDSLAGEIERLLSVGLPDSLTAQRVLTLRHQLKQVDSLLAVLHQRETGAKAD